MHRFSNPRLSLGCGYLFLVTVIACLLLLVNSFLVFAGLSAYESWAEEAIREVRFRQTLQFVLPVLLIFMEYWLYDRFVDYLGPSSPTQA